MNLRYHLFWLMDSFRGQPLRRQWHDIQNTLQLPYKQGIERATTQLRTLLKHARTTVPYYREHARDDQLTSWPVINKFSIRSQPSQFLSESTSIEKLKKVVTSGSTGTPFQVYHSKRKRLRNTADTLVFANRAGFRTGDRLYYFKIWNRENQKTRFTSFAQNVIPCDVTSLSNDEIQRLINRLKSDRSNKGFLGYASAYDAIARFCDRNAIAKIESNVRSIIAMSEGLDQDTRMKMSKIFACPTVSRYSNVENGIIAQQSIDGGPEFEVNFASYHLEILSLDADTPVPSGELGRIVVTDLYNDAMPMIRYDTGDTGRLTYCHTTGKPLLSAVEGRKMDLVYDTQERLVSSFTITNQMWKYTEVIQYQFIQKSRFDFEFILNVDGSFQREAELIAEFQGYFGQDANIAIRYTSEIPLLASGKRKKVRNESQSKTFPSEKR